jgi:Outer membrane protein beta-barrel domain
MKKITLITFSIIFTQIVSAQKISIGPEAGVNLIQTESTELGNNFQLGMHFGAHIKYHFNDQFALSSGIFLTQKKKKYTSLDTTTTADPIGGLVGGLFGGFGGGGFPGGGTSNEAQVFTTTYGLVSELYIEVPILANYEISNINFYLGPHVSFLITANSKEFSEEESTATDISSFIPGGFGNLLQGFQTPPNEGTTSSTSKDGLRTLDIGFTAGIGYRANDHLHFNLMYTYGFLDYREETENLDLENHQITRFSIVYLFNLKGNKEAEIPHAPRMK